MTKQNVTYFESPNFPKASQKNFESCSLTILLARDVKQVLVDFLFFELSPPTAGNCEEDKFVVSGHAVNFQVPVICGIATGQHSSSFDFLLLFLLNSTFQYFLVFIDVENSAKIQFYVLTNTASDRAFSIKITQLRDNLAPQGCLQFHKNSEGIIKTFNYNDNSQIATVRRPSYFVSKLSQ